MINSDELLYIVDGENRPLEPQKRSFAHANGLWHRTTGVWIINTKEQILCQKRSLKKDVKPGFWEAYMGGHVGPDDDYVQNTIKECKEELGVDMDKNALIPYKVFKSDKPTHKEFQLVFALTLDKDVSELHLEEDEIDEVQWIALDALKKILSDPKTQNWVKKPWDEEVLEWLSINYHQ